MDNNWMIIPAFNLNNLSKKEISDCNLVSSRYGLTLSEEDIKELSIARYNTLKKSGRIEFSGGIIKKLIDEFCDSPYISQNNYTITLFDLIELFYYFKNVSNDGIGDDELIKIMKKYYDDKCFGSIDLLQDHVLKFLENNMLME